MRAARTVNRWTSAWGLLLLSLGIFYNFPAQAQQSPITDTAAQGGAPQSRPSKHHHYQLVDIGTFGGPASYFSNGFDGILNDQRVAVGWADTSTPDPHPPFCFSPDCFVSHAFQTRNGVVTDLGVLPGGLSSQPTWITAETAAQARPAQITESSAPASGAKFAPTELMTRYRSALTRRNQRFGTLQK